MLASLVAFAAVIAVSMWPVRAFADAPRTVVNVGSRPGAELQVESLATPSLLGAEEGGFAALAGGQLDGFLTLTESGGADSFSVSIDSIVPLSSGDIDPPWVAGLRVPWSRQATPGGPGPNVDIIAIADVHRSTVVPNDLRSTPVPSAGLLAVVGFALLGALRRRDLHP